MYKRQPADAGRTGAWSRVEGSTARLEPALSTTGQHQDIDSWKAQFGVDRLLAGEQGGSRLVGGLALHYGKADTRVSSAYGDGTIDTTAYGLVPTLTWYGKDGVYVDAQAQATWFDSDLKSRLAGKLKDGQRARSVGFGVEAGKAFTLNDSLALIPQAQLTYASTHSGSFNDRFGALVDPGKATSLLGRVGVALDYKRRWQAGGHERESSLYGVINLKHEFLDGTRLRVADVPFSSRMTRTWGSLGVGANYGWGGRYAIYGQVAVSYTHLLAADGDEVVLGLDLPAQPAQAGLEVLQRRVGDVVRQAGGLEVGQREGGVAARRIQRGARFVDAAAGAVQDQHGGMRAGRGAGRQVERADQAFLAHFLAGDAVRGQALGEARHALGEMCIRDRSGTWGHSAVMWASLISWR